MLRGAAVACGEIETKTLADGSFSLDSLDLGTYKVTVGLQGFNTASKAVTLKKGEEVTLDFSLSRATGTAKIHGRVYDVESKKAIGKAGSVILILPVANKYKDIDRNGHYEFENLPAGTYKILTSIPGYGSHDTSLKVTEGEKVTYDFPCRPIDIEEPPWG